MKIYKSDGYKVRHKELTAHYKKPDWLKRVIRNEKARLRYFINRYGKVEGLARMKAKSDKFDAWMDEQSAKMEYEDDN